jgi:hypothetical protein
VKFEKSDWDWSDANQDGGLSRERLERYELLLADIKRRVEEIISLHDLTVDVPRGIFAVGVQGDERSYTPVVILRGQMPEKLVLDKISNKISNTLPVSRVTFEIVAR